MARGPRAGASRGATPGASSLGSALMVAGLVHLGLAVLGLVGSSVGALENESLALRLVVAGVWCAGFGAGGFTSGVLAATMGNLSDARRRLSLAVAVASLLVVALGAVFIVQVAAWDCLGTPSTCQIGQ